MLFFALVSTNKCLCALGVVSLSQLQKKHRGDQNWDTELHCEYCLSHSPPAPPLSCQALSLSPLL